MTVDCDTALSTLIERWGGEALADALYEVGVLTSLERTDGQLLQLSRRRRLRTILHRDVVPALRRAYDRGVLPEVAPVALAALRWSLEVRDRVGSREWSRHRLVRDVSWLWYQCGGALSPAEAAALVESRYTYRPGQRGGRGPERRLERALAPYIRALGVTRAQQRRTAESLLRLLEGRHPTATVAVAGLEFSRELLVFLLATRLFEA